jgi:predicted AlkP superfamily pyrophosphatase or phosphodiesterase
LKKLLAIQVAALGHQLLRENNISALQGMEFHPATSVLGALTCTVQGSFRTATPPGDHGMIANGLYHRQLNRPMFWEQSSRLVGGRRIWDEFRARGQRVGMMFWQQSLGESVDLILSPAPIHKHHGGMIQDCYAQPAGLYERLFSKLGRRFQLHQYWGPLASAKVGDWIAAATSEVLADRQIAPQLLLTYLPSLDYDLQRFGPAHPKSVKALQRTLAQLELMVQAARREGYEVLIFGDYAIAPVREAVFPNRALHQAGLMSTREIRGMLYADFHTSTAFAMVDHEIAHVYVQDEASMPAVRQTLANLPGVGEILDRPQQAQRGLAHANSGDLVLLAAPGRWFAYPWWTGKRQQPDYATHVDIHNKPGYDPCELFFGWPPPSTSQDVSKIRGSHGNVGPGREIAWTSSMNLQGAQTLVEIAAAVEAWLGEVS